MPSLELTWARSTASMRPLLLMSSRKLSLSVVCPWLRCLIGIGAIDDAIIDDAIAANIAEQQDRRHLGGGNSVALVVVHVCQGKDEILGVAGSRKTNAKTIGSLACRLTPWTMPQEAATRADVVRRTSV